MIYFWTIAYNASKTLNRALDSVLNQTYRDFCYYVCDNGSTDDRETRRIIEKYATYDARISPFYNEENHVYTGNEKFRYLAHNINDEDYFCFLDADDEYISNFLEQMLEFMEKNHLDIAACGSDFISVTQNNSFIGSRMLAEDLILEGRDFADYYSDYHQFLRSCWGKVFKGKTLRNTILDLNAPNYPRAYGDDTFFTTRTFRDSKRVGILAKSLHKYYVSPQSVSFRFNPQRIECDQILHEDAIHFLESYGNISEENKDFLYAVYFGAIKDTLQIIYNAQISDLEKISLLHKIFDCNYTKTLLSMNNSYIGDESEQFKKETAAWILSRAICRKKEGAEAAAGIINRLYPVIHQIMNEEDLEFIILKMPQMIEYLMQNDYRQVLNQIRIWFKKYNTDNKTLTKLELTACNALKWPDDEIFLLLVKVKKKRVTSARTLNIDGRITHLLSGYSMLKDISADLSVLFPHVICRIIKEKYMEALDALISIPDVEINDGDCQSYFMLGLNLSAAAGNGGSYIYFKKLWVSYLIDRKQSKEAFTELEELVSILPEDKDLAALHKRLESL